MKNSQNSHVRLLIELLIAFVLLLCLYSCGVLLSYVRTKKSMTEDTKIFLISNGLGSYGNNKEFKTVCTNNIPGWLK